MDMRKISDKLFGANWLVINIVFFKLLILKLIKSMNEIFWIYCENVLQTLSTNFVLLHLKIKKGEFYKIFFVRITVLIQLNDSKTHQDP